MFNFDTTGYVPSTAVEMGEYELQIVALDIKEKDMGNGLVNKRFSILTRVVGADNAKDIFAMIPIPSMQDEKSTLNFKIGKVKEFEEAFGVTLNDLIGGIADEGVVKNTMQGYFVGKTARAFVTKKMNDQTNEMENNIARWLKVR